MLRASSSCILRLISSVPYQIAQVSHSTSQLHMATTFHFFKVKSLLSSAAGISPSSFLECPAEAIITKVQLGIGKDFKDV